MKTGRRGFLTAVLGALGAAVLAPLLPNPKMMVPGGWLVRRGTPFDKPERILARRTRTWSAERIWVQVFDARDRCIEEMYFDRRLTKEETYRVHDYLWSKWGPKAIVTSAPWRRA